MFEVVGRQVGTKEVSVAFGKLLGGSKMILNGFSELGLCVELLVIQGMLSRL